MNIRLQVIYILNIIPIKISMRFFPEIEKKIPKCKHKFPNSQGNWPRRGCRDSIRFTFYNRAVGRSLELQSGVDPGTKHNVHHWDKRLKSKHKQL